MLQVHAAAHPRSARARDLQRQARSSASHLVSCSQIPQACSFCLCPCQMSVAFALSARALSPPALVTLAVSAPPRCLKHPPAAAAAMLLLANCRLLVSCLLVQLFPSCAYSESYSPSSLTSAFLFFITSITRIFRLLFAHVCDLHPLIYTRTHTRHHIQPCKLGPLVCALSLFPLALQTQKSVPVDCSIVAPNSMGIEWGKLERKLK